MDFFIRYKKKNTGRKTTNRDWPIGIFGSFDPHNKIFLLSLQGYLNKKGYYAMLSEDMGTYHPPGTGERRHAYSRRLSEALVEECKIHIVFFFHEPDGEHTINQSASMEIERMYMKECKNVLVVSENSINKQFRSMMKGLQERSTTEIPLENWQWPVFTRYNSPDKSTYKDPDLESGVMMYCQGIIPKTLH